MREPCAAYVFEEGGVGDSRAAARTWARVLFQCGTGARVLFQCGSGPVANSLRRVACCIKRAMRGSSSQHQEPCAARLLSIKAAQFIERSCMWHRKSHARLDFSTHEAMRGLSSGSCGNCGANTVSTNSSQDIKNTLRGVASASKPSCAARWLCFWPCTAYVTD